MKNIFVLASIMASAMMLADINLIDLATLSLIVDKNYIVTLDFINGLPEQQQRARERLTEFFKKVAPFVHARQTVYSYAGLGARATLYAELKACQKLKAAQNLGNLLIPPIDQQEAGAHPVTWYLEKAKHYTEREGDLVRNYVQRVKDLLAEHEATYGTTPDFYAAQGYVRNFEQIQAAWQEFDREIATLEKFTAEPLDPENLEQQAIKVEDFQEKNGLIIKPEEATDPQVRSRVTAIINLKQRAKDRLLQARELTGPSCVATQEQAELQEKLQQLVNKSYSLIKGSKVAQEYAKNINSCSTPFYNHLKDRKMSKEEEMVLVAAAKRLQEVGVTLDALKDAEQRVVKTADAIVQGKFKQYEDVEIEVKPTAAGITFYYIVPEAGNKQSFYAAAEFATRLDQEMARFEQGLVKDFVRAAEYYFVLQGKTMDEVLADPNVPGEEKGFFNWVKAVTGIRPLDQRIKSISQNLERLRQRIVWFKELVLLLPQAQNKAYDAGILGIESKDPQQAQRQRELLEIFAFSTNELEVSKLFEGQNLQTIVGNALPYVWLGYRERYQQAYGAGATSPIIDRAEMLMKAFNNILGNLPDKAQYSTYAITNVDHS